MLLHINATVDTLLASHYEKIREAYSYNLLKDGAVLIYIPVPVSYVYWHNPDQSAMTEIETFLSDLKIKKI